MVLVYGGIKMKLAKYELTSDSIEWDGRKLHRIRALHDFGDVKCGELGGYIENEGNLVNGIDPSWGRINRAFSWVWPNAKVYGCASVRGDAQVYDYAVVHGSAMVYGAARVYGNARVYGRARVHDDAQVFGNARVHGEAEIYQSACVSSDCVIAGDTQLAGNAEMKNGESMFSGGSSGTGSLIGMLDYMRARKMGRS